MNECIENVLWEFRNFAKKAWLIVKHRPWLRCPFCEGKGGEMSGYYEPEWCECRTCHDHYEALEDHGLNWFVGRLPLLDWLRAKASIRAGLSYSASLVDILRCWSGLHNWDDGQFADGQVICRTCYEPKPPKEGDALGAAKLGGDAEWTGEQLTTESEVRDE